MHFVFLKTHVFPGKNYYSHYYLNLQIIVLVDLLFDIFREEHCDCFDNGELIMENPLMIYIHLNYFFVIHFQIEFNHLYWIICFSLLNPYFKHDLIVIVNSFQVELLVIQLEELPTSFSSFNHGVEKHYCFLFSRRSSE